MPVSPHHRPRNSRTESTGIDSLGVTQLRSSKAGNQSQASPTQGAPLFIIYSAAPHPREGGEVLNASHGVILAFLCFWVKIVVRPGVRSRRETSVLVSVGDDTLQPVFITVFKAVTQSLD